MLIILTIMLVMGWSHGYQCPHFSLFSMYVINIVLHFLFHFCIYGLILMCCRVYVFESVSSCVCVRELWSLPVYWGFCGGHCIGVLVSTSCFTFASMG